MAFVEQTAQPFTKEGIAWLNPNQTGVYGIYRDGLWIYVGLGDLRDRLFDHLHGDNPCIIAQGPTHYVTEVWPDPVAREKELIVELAPVCNKRVG